MGTSKEEKKGKGWMVSPASWLLKGDTPPDLSQPLCEVWEDTLSSMDGSSMICSSVSKYVSVIIISVFSNVVLGISQKMKKSPQPILMMRNQNLN